MESYTLKDPIFVTGPPRSGTTLIQLLISAHDNIYTLPETHYFTYVKGVVGNDFEDEYTSLVLSAISEKPGLIFDKRSLNKIQNCVTKLGVSDRNILDCLVREYKSINELEGVRWLEKTPRHVLKIDKIKECWPESCVFVVIRDPRGAISSFHSKCEFSSSYSRYMDLFRRIDLWKSCIAAMNKTTASFKVIRYETFIAEPKSVLDEIMEYIGEKQQVSQLSSFSTNFSSATLKTEKHKKLNASAEIVDRTMIWVERLTNNEVKWIEFLCSNEMNQFGYLKSQLSVFPVSRVFFYIVYKIRSVIYYLKQVILK